MKIARVIGKVWATVKDERLVGIKLYLIQPLNHQGQPSGRPLVAADTVGSGIDELVFWVGGFEATLAFADRRIPSDCSIVGIIDTLTSGDPLLMEPPTC